MLITLNTLNTSHAEQGMKQHEGGKAICSHTPIITENNLCITMIYSKNASNTVKSKLEINTLTI